MIPNYFRTFYNGDSQYVPIIQYNTKQSIFVKKVSENFQVKIVLNTKLLFNYFNYNNLIK